MSVPNRASTSVMTVLAASALCSAASGANFVGASKQLPVERLRPSV